MNELMNRIDSSQKKSPCWTSSHQDNNNAGKDADNTDLYLLVGCKLVQTSWRSERCKALEKKTRPIT